MIKPECKIRLGICPVILYRPTVLLPHLLYEVSVLVGRMDSEIGKLARRGNANSTPEDI